MKSLLPVISLILAIQLNAQTIVSGNVSDKKNQPIFGANVYIENTYDGATTDSEGNFSFNTELTGTITLVISNMLGW